MSDQIEAAGALVTAGVAANALDHAATGTHSPGGACPNCGAALTGPFCGQCGQRAHLHRTVGEVFHEFLHGITHFDGKAWTTLPMLMFRPGKLTRSYIDGQRARYVAPVPLFLLVVFLMFFVFSFMNVGDNIGGGATTDDGKQMTQAEAIKELPKIDAELAKLDAQIQAAENSKEPGELAGLNGARIGVAAGRDRVKIRATGKVDSPLDIAGELAQEIKEADEDGKMDFNLGSDLLNDKARKALKNPELVFYKLQSKAYKLSFLLVPLSLPWLWLVFFWKRGVGMYDHAIFTLYSISFMSLTFIAASLLVSAGISSGYVWGPLLLAPGVHMFVQLRGAYQLGRFSAAWRTTYLSLAAVLTLSFYLMILIVAGVLD